MRIAPLSVLAEEEGDRRKLAEAKALAGDLRVQTFSLSYAKAGDVSPLLVKSALSQRGQIQVDARTNTIIITDLPDRLADRVGAARRARSSRTAGRSGSARRADDARICQGDRRSVGPERPRDARHRQYDRSRVPEQRHAQRADRARSIRRTTTGRPRTTTTGDGRQPSGSRRDLRDRPRGWRRQRRVQHRRRVDARSSAAARDGSSRRRG